MDRTLIGDLEAFCALLVRQFAGECDLAFDSIEQAPPGLTFRAVVGVGS